MIMSRQPYSLARIRVICRRTWLAGILVLLLFPNAFAQTDFSTFWETWNRGHRWRQSGWKFTGLDNINES